MADVKISELPALTTSDGAEELVVNDGGTTKKITGTNLLAGYVSKNSTTGAASMPSGTTAQRPTGALGMFRHNSTLDQFEGYNDGEWGALAGGGELSKITYEFIATAGQTSFTGSDLNSNTLSYTVGSIIVSYGGLDLAFSDYTATNGSSITLADGAVVGKIVRIVAFTTFAVADTYTQSQADVLLAAKSPLASPVFTGNVSHGDNVTGHLVLSGGEVHFNNSDNTSNHLVINSAGIVTKPLQPAFQARVTSNLQNLPINGHYVIPYGTERFDQNSDFNPSTYTFTAPVTGKYQLNGTVYLNNVVSASGYVEFYITTSNETYYSILSVNGFDTDLLYFTMPHTVLADMDAGDTAKCSIWLASGSQTTDLRDDSFFSGYLVA